MNAPSISRTELERGDNPGDSDSDNSDGIPDYYQPISPHYGDGDGDDDVDGDPNSNPNEVNINGYHTIHPPRSSSYNGHDYRAESVNGMRSLNLSNEDRERESQEQEEQEEVEEEESRSAEWDGEMRRAFEEDESRRNAPLTAENASRVLDAMRGVSFSGLPPVWASDIPEDRWLHQLRRMRQPPRSAS